MPKPSLASSSRSCLPYSGPRVPTWRERGGVEDALLDRAAERRAVGVLGAEVGVPGVEVRVEVQQRDRARACGRRRAAAAGRWCGRRRGSSAGRRWRAGRRRRPGRSSTASSMSNGLAAMSPASATWATSNGRRVVRRVVRAQQPRRLADGVGAEAGAGPVGHAAVERHADHGDVGVRRPRRGAAAARTWPGPRSAGSWSCRWDRSAASSRNLLVA